MGSENTIKLDEDIQCHKNVSSIFCIKREIPVIVFKGTEVLGWGELFDLSGNSVIFTAALKLLSVHDDH